MSGIVFACIAPHGSMIIPLLGEKDAEKALTTRLAMEELGRRAAATKPETIVLITPHALGWRESRPARWPDLGSLARAPHLAR